MLKQRVVWLRRVEQKNAHQFFTRSLNVNKSIRQLDTRNQIVLSDLVTETMKASRQIRYNYDIVGVDISKLGRSPYVLLAAESTLA